MLTGAQQLRRRPESIPNVQLGFPEPPDYVIKLPDGVTAENALATYCRPNLVKDGLVRQQRPRQFWNPSGAIMFPRFWDNWPTTFRRTTTLGARGLKADLQQVGLNLVRGGFLRRQFAPQFWGHRGAIKFPDFGDNWPDTFRRATTLGARGLEADLQQVGLVEGKDAMFIPVHDRNGRRILVDREGFFSMYRPEEIIGQPIVVHQIKDEKETGKYYVTNQTVSILLQVN